MSLIFRATTSLSPDSPPFLDCCSHLLPSVMEEAWLSYFSHDIPRYPGKSNRRKDFFCVTIQGYSPSWWVNSGSQNWKQQATHCIQLASPSGVGAQGTRTHLGWVFLVRELNQSKSAQPQS